MADRKAEFALQLTDEASGAADSVANALGNLRRSIEGDQRELAAMQKAMRNLQMGTTVNVDQFRKLKASIDAKRQSIATAQSQYLNLGGTFAKTGGQGRGLESRFQALQKQILAMPGPLGQLGGSLGRVGGMVAGGGVIAGGVLVIVAALAALSAASAVAVVALAKYGIAQADARRSELLRLEGLAKLRFFYQRMPGNANEMQAAIDKVAGVTALGRGELEKYTGQLHRMGLRGANLTLALEGVAIKAATQGDQAAQVFAGWAASAALTGRSINRLVDDVRARLGGIAMRQMLSLDVQSRKLKESLSALFDDVKIESFLIALKSITDLFSTSTASGKALKQIVETIMRPLLEHVSAAGPLFKRFFQGLILGAQEVTIAILKVRIWLRNTFGDAKILDGIDGMTGALKLGKVAVYGVAAGLLLAAGAALTIGGAIALPIVAFLQLLSIADKVWEAIKKLAARVKKFFVETDWKSLGLSIVDGIVGALTGAGGMLVDAMKGLGSEAIKGFKLALGIASPSKVFERLGVSIPKGVEVGVTAGTPSAQRAVSEIAPMPTVPTVGSAAATPTVPSVRTSPTDARDRPAPGSPLGIGSSTSGGGGGLGSRGPMSVTATFGDMHFHGDVDRKAAGDFVADFKRQLADALEGVAIQLGAPVAGDA